MKDFKKNIIEILLQITILASVYRYPQRNNNNNQQNSQNYLNSRDPLLLLHRNRFDTTHNIDYLLRLKEQSDFSGLHNISPENYTHFEELLGRDNFSLNSFLNFPSLHHHHQRQNLSLYPAFFEFTDKFIDRSSFEQQQQQQQQENQDTLNSNSLQSSENLSEEDMNAIKQILFEQDIDIGIGKEYFDIALDSNGDIQLNNNKLLQKNILNEINFDYQKKKEEQKNDDIISAITLLDSHRLPDGFKLIVEEDTGEIITIPANYTDFPINQNLVNITRDNQQQIFNQTRNSNHTIATDEQIGNNDTLFIDELLYSKSDDSWFKAFSDFDMSILSPPPQSLPNQTEIIKQEPLQQPTVAINNTIDGIDRQDSFFNTQFIQEANNIFNDDLINSEAPTNVVTPSSQILNSQISIGNFEDVNFFSTSDFENFLTNQSDQLFDEQSLSEHLRTFLSGINDFENTTTTITNLPPSTYTINHPSTSDDSGVESNDGLSDHTRSHRSSSLIRSSITDDGGDDGELEGAAAGGRDQDIDKFDQDEISLLSENDIKIEYNDEMLEGDAQLYGIRHNHTYLETIRNDTKEEIYHPHSYKNKIKNLMALNNRTTKDEKLIRQYQVEYTLDQIVNSEVEEFNEMLRNTNMNTDQLNVMKDIRRRGKNKIAAQICRKRKIDSIESLHEDVDTLRIKKKTLEKERSKIQDEIKEFTKKIDQLYKDLLGSNQDPNDPIIVYINNLLERFNEQQQNKRDDKPVTKPNKRQ